MERFRSFRKAAATVAGASRNLREVAATVAGTGRNLREVAATVAGARQGNTRRALEVIHCAYARLLTDGLPREAVAAALDCGQLRCRAGLSTPINWRQTRKLTQRCLDRRSDLAPGHRDGLGEILSVLRDYPEDAFFQMVELRRSFLAPVPGVMAERIGPPGWN